MKTQSKEALLRLVDNLREAIVSSDATYGKWTVEKPSLDVKYPGMPYAEWEGQNHTRHTCIIDIYDSQSSTQKVNEDE